MSALRDALKKTDPDRIRGELAKHVPGDVQRILAAAGIRDEFIFPTTTILSAKPTLLGYYRLLMGISQKRFYGTGTGLGALKSMEESGVLNARQSALLPEFCAAVAIELSELVRQVTPLSAEDLNDLPLLTLGAQLYGSNNNAIGRQATRDVFLAISDIVGTRKTSQTEKKIELMNSAGRLVSITLGSDPDISIVESFKGTPRNKVAIEIKGGSDRSNAHNRAGEAEKSHQKAKHAGFRDFWTIITKDGIEKALIAESPTTRSWYEVTEVLARGGRDWQEFRSRLCGELGIPE